MLQYVIDHLDHAFNVIQSFVPENLHFVLNDEDVSTIEYDISSSAKDLNGNNIITGNDFISPHNTHWRLRYGPSVTIAAGVHTSVKMTYSQNYMSVAGSDWLWYLDQRFMPFSGAVNHAYDYTLMNPIMPGVNYEINSVDLSTALTAILNMALGRTNSLPITYTLAASGLIIDYHRLDLADTTTLLEIIKDLCSYDPGRAFEITPGRVFEISTGARWYGDPNAIANDSANANLVWTINNSNPPLDLDFTNVGPGCTHIQGEGSGTTTREIVTLGNLENQGVYWRTDKPYQFNDAITRATVLARTQEQLAFDLNPVHEIPIYLDPDMIDKQISVNLSHNPGDDDGWFWSNIKPGRALWVDLQLLAHHIQSAHHIVSMDCTVEDNGSAKVTVSQNQIYDTSGQAFVEEG